MRICACVTGKTEEECLEAIRRAEKISADFLELRIDFLRDKEKIADIIRACRLPVIATNRAEGNGGHFRGSEETRVNLLLEAIESGCDFVDVEMDCELRDSVMEKAREKDCKVIMSMHDFKGTPDDAVLRSWMGEMEKSADLGKIATTANSMEDCHRILSLLLLECKTPMIAFCMGNLGKFTRIVAPLYGSYLTYASINGVSAGKGQLHATTMKNVYEEVLR
jgi:3-dehydroquinate dehydratase type I